MTVSFTNNWKNILDKLRNVLRTEFKGALPVYIGKEGSEGSQYIRLDPVASEWMDEMAQAETREIAEQIKNLTENKFPISWKYLVGEGYAK